MILFYLRGLRNCKLDLTETIHFLSKLRTQKEQTKPRLKN
uniref:Uncharacterized protein n=1 Tax=Rhizophora mucronata TaxID=61149 RepID=A0A2P2NDZ8_RHIMU